MPPTVKRRMRGTTPAGVTEPAAIATTTGSPTFTPSLPASSEPSTTAKAPGRSDAKDPLVSRSPSADTWRS